MDERYLKRIKNLKKLRIETFELLSRQYTVFTKFIEYVLAETTIEILKFRIPAGVTYENPLKTVHISDFGDVNYSLREVKFGNSLRKLDNNILFEQSFVDLLRRNQEYYQNSRFKKVKPILSY
jgi:hypothetical protein